MISIRELLKSNPVHAARSLLGCTLTTSNGVGVTSGIIVEVEAYGGIEDPASHAHRGPTKRAGIMFGESGLCYVYLIYGMHYCVNVVSGKVGEGSAVLIRAIEPLRGLEIMKQQRAVASLVQLTNGPSKVCQALGISKDHLGENLFESQSISIQDYLTFNDDEIEAGPRVGISKAENFPWRLFVKGNSFVSRGK